MVLFIVMSKLTGWKVRSNLPILFLHAINIHFCLKLLAIPVRFIVKLMNFGAETLSSGLEGTQLRPEWALGIAFLAH